MKALDYQKELARCDLEIARIIEEASAGNLDIDGMMLGLHDWRTEKILIEKERLDRIRAAMVSVYGGMGKGSAIWGQGQWDKGWTAGIRAAILAFDTERNKYADCGV
jgi:hypothetical protein